MHSETYTKPSSYQLAEAERVFMHRIPRLRLLVETQEEIVDDIADSFFAVILQGRENSTST